MLTLLGTHDVGRVNIVMMLLRNIGFLTSDDHSKKHYIVREGEKRVRMIRDYFKPSTGLEGFLERDGAITQQEWDEQVLSADTANTAMASLQQLPKLLPQEANSTRAAKRKQAPEGSSTGKGSGKRA